jgi:hypothetical protein
MSFVINVGTGTVPFFFWEMLPGKGPGKGQDQSSYPPNSCAEKFLQFTPEVPTDATFLGFQLLYVQSFCGSK